MVPTAQNCTPSALFAGPNPAPVTVNCGPLTAGPTVGLTWLTTGAVVSRKSTPLTLPPRVEAKIEVGSGLVPDANPDGATV